MNVTEFLYCNPQTDITLSFWSPKIDTLENRRKIWHEVKIQTHSHFLEEIYISIYFTCNQTKKKINFSVCEIFALLAVVSLFRAPPLVDAVENVGDLADDGGGDEEPSRDEEGEVVALRGVVDGPGDGGAQHGGGPAEQHQQPESRCLNGVGRVRP